MRLSELIKLYRSSQHLSQDDLAALAGISKPYISMLENEKNTKTGKPIVPSILTLQKLSKAMGLDFDDFIKKIDDDVTISISEKDFPKAHFCKLNCTDSEKDLIKKYRCLSPEGKATVDAVVDIQYQAALPRVKNGGEIS